MFKSQSKFENLELGRANKHAFIFGSGPVIAEEDTKRGLILEANRRDFLSKFCTNICTKQDNLSTNRPKNLWYANYATREIVKAGAQLSTDSYELASVYSSKELVNAAYPKWRYTSEVVKMHFHQRALEQLSKESDRRPYAFTMLISPELGKQVITNGGSGYLHERLVLKMKRTLGRQPLMWLKLEAVKTKSNHNITRHGKGFVDRSNGLLHAHGAIALDSDESAVFGRIVSSINNSSDTGFRNHEIQTKLIKDGAYWVEYCNKHRMMNLIFLNGMKRYSRSMLLGKLAENIYEAERRVSQRFNHGR